MKSILYIIVLCLLTICSACNNGVEHRNGNKEKSVTITSINETQEDSLYPKWCSLVDSLTCYSEKQLPNNLHVYLNKGSKLNKESKVYKTLAPLCSVGDTIYFIENINTMTATVFFTFWKKSKERVFGTRNLYHYRYYWYEKERKSNFEKRELVDSADIVNNPQIRSISEKLFTVCNAWDVKQLQTNHDLDGVSGDIYHMLAYRVILNKKRPIIDCVRIAKQGSSGDEVTAPYQVILLDEE